MYLPTYLPTYLRADFLESRLVLFQPFSTSQVALVSCYLVLLVDRAARPDPDSAAKLTA